MRNVAFAIWMAGFAAATNMMPVPDLSSLSSEQWTAAIVNAAVNTGIWLFVGSLLYEPKPKTNAPQPAGS